MIAGGDDDAADVPADMGWSHATASDTATKATVDWQTDLLGDHSRPRQLHPHSQHSSR